jgi:hypothetical protein
MGVAAATVVRVRVVVGVGVWGWGGNECVEQTWPRFTCGCWSFSANELITAMHEYNVNHFHHRTASNGSGPTAHGTMPKLNIRICATSDVAAPEWGSKECV